MTKSTLPNLNKDLPPPPPIVSYSSQLRKQALKPKCHSIRQAPKEPTTFERPTPGKLFPWSRNQVLKHDDKAPWNCKLLPDQRSKISMHGHIIKPLHPQAVSYSPWSRKQALKHDDKGYTELARSIAVGPKAPYHCKLSLWSRKYVLCSRQRQKEKKQKIGKWRPWRRRPKSGA